MGKKWVLLFALACGSILLHGQEVVHVNNGATVALNAGAIVSVQGGITLDNGSKLINKGTVDLRSNNTFKTADWTDKGTTPYAYGTGWVQFNGVQAQVIQGIDSFQRIEVNNAAGITLANNVNSRQWYLINGKVNTGNFYAIATGMSDSAVKADAANPSFTKSWIMGHLRRYLDPVNVNQYSFPVGPTGNANRVVLDNLKADPMTGVKYIDAQFGAKPGTDLGLILTESGQPYTMVNGAGVWYITPDAEPSSGSFDLLMYLTGFTGLQDNAFSILRRDIGSSDARDWTVPAGGKLPANGSEGRTVASGYARRNGVTAFSQFGIGMTQTPLPIILSSFDARRVSAAIVQLDWTTSVEVNSKGFDVEERNDADSGFRYVAFVSSKAIGGTSNAALEYQYVDHNSYAGVSYYRLKESDLDGQYRYSQIRAVAGNSSSTVAILLYPNPNKGQFRIRLDGSGSSQTRPIRIIDQGGAIVRSMTLTGDTDLMVTGLAAGAYVVQVLDAFGPGRHFTQKVLIVR